jgi:hypothetical protein
MKVELDFLGFLSGVRLRRLLAAFLKASSINLDSLGRTSSLCRRFHPSDSDIFENTTHKARQVPRLLPGELHATIM